MKKILLISSLGLLGIINFASAYNGHVYRDNTGHMQCRLEYNNGNTAGFCSCGSGGNCSSCGGSVGSDCSGAPSPNPKPTQMAPAQKL